MKDVETRLDADRARTAARLAALRGDFGAIVDASRDSNADDEHDPEGATIAFERSQVDALIGQAERHLAEIDASRHGPRLAPAWCVPEPVRGWSPGVAMDRNSAVPRDVDPDVLLLVPDPGALS